MSYGGTVTTVFFSFRGLWFDHVKFSCWILLSYIEPPIPLVAHIITTISVSSRSGSGDHLR